MRLRDLDEQLVPRLAAALRRARPGGSAGDPGDPGHAPPRGPLLVRLDDRFARSGPLALLRDVPQLAALLVAAVFLAGAGLAFARSGGTTLVDGPEGAVTSADGRGPEVGPAVGDGVQDYLVGSRERLADLAARRPDDTFLALVSLSRHATPAEAGALAADVPVRLALLRAPLVGGDQAPELLTTPVADLVPQLEALCAATAVRKAEDADDLRAFAETIDEESDPEARSAAEASAETAVGEAAVFGGDCNAVFGLVVEATAAQLAALPLRQGVRAVEPAGAGLRLEDLVVRPLLPEAVDLVEELIAPALPGEG